MSFTCGPWRAVTVAIACLLAGCGSTATHSTATRLDGQRSPSCTLGSALGKGRQLLAPRRDTFYSVDVLNPDVVFFHGRYLMYFSGNDLHVQGGNWRTGLAIARSPLGPFRVQRTLEGQYLNGGTTVWHGRLWHVVEDNPVDDNDIRSELASSSDGVHWRHVSFLPGLTNTGVTYHGADFFLEPKGPRLSVYMLAVPPGGGLGRSLGLTSYAAGSWSPLRIILNISAVATLPWASADLGEPAVYHLPSGSFLLFVGLADNKRTRSIGLARAVGTSWDLCGDTPALPNGTPWGPASSIDPSPLIVGDRLYLYYGATRTSGLGGNLGGSVGVRVFLEPRAG
jgi:hypothetical protein